jgi:hypothetical protein
VTDTNTEQILFKMNEGFSHLHDRLNTIADQSSTQRLGCAKRFGEIELNLGIGTAINKEKEKAKAVKVRLQSGLVLTVLSTITIGILVIIWKIFLGHIDLIVK